jgi:hypothetical protein
MGIMAQMPWYPDRLHVGRAFHSSPGIRGPLDPNLPKERIFGHFPIWGPK